MATSNWPDEGELERALESTDKFLPGLPFDSESHKQRFARTLLRAFDADRLMREREEANEGG
jgi:hypothetical protein